MRVYPYPQYPRESKDPDLYLDNLERIARENDQCGFTGVLIFTTLDDPDDHWQVATHLVRVSSQVPVVALTPNWEHPVISARRIASFQRFAERPFAINWITGTLLSDYKKLGFELDKDERYHKLAEYIDIVNALLAGKPVTHEGKYFTVRKHALKRVPSQPVLQYISGGSEACEAIVRERAFLSQITTGLAPGHRYGAHVRGLGFGVLARPTDEEATEVFAQQFPESRAGEIYLELAKKNTDSSWKGQLFESANEAATGPGFHASALKNGSDTGYMVGSYERVAEHVKALRASGVDTLFVNMVTPDEVKHLRRVFEHVS